MRDNERKRLELILKARSLYYEKKLSKGDIVTELGIPFKRLRKYLNGDPNAVSRHGGAGKGGGSPLDEYIDIIVELIREGMPYKDIFQVLVKQGYKGSRKTLYGFCERRFGSKRQHQTLNKGHHFVLRKTIFDHIWSGKPLDTYDKQWVFSLHPELFDIRDAVSEFRRTMEQRNESQMMNWVLLADSISIPKIKAFFCGLKRDFDAVLNSVKHVENNAVLEGNVNRLKMIKRTMYGRAGYDLLRAKVLRGVVMI